MRVFPIRTLAALALLGVCAASPAQDKAKTAPAKDVALPVITNGTTDHSSNRATAGETRMLPTTRAWRVVRTAAEWSGLRARRHRAPCDRQNGVSPSASRSQYDTRQGAAGPPAGPAGSVSSQAGRAGLPASSHAV